jgi:hypothetical protein
MGHHKKLFRVALGVVCLNLISNAAATAQIKSGNWKWQNSQQNCCPPPPCVPYCPPTAPVDGLSPAPGPAMDPSLSPVPSAPTSPDASPAPADPGAPANSPPAQDPVANQPNFAQPQINNALANVGDTGSRGSRAPNMIGDFFGTSGTPYVSSIVGPAPPGFFNPPLGSPTSSFGNLAAAPGASVGRLKLTENGSIIPQDRFFVNYSYFNDARIYDGVDVHRITPGFEKTIFGDDISVEVRFPFADTASSNVNTTIGPNKSVTEFGNMSVWLKAVIAENCHFVVSTGLGLTLPTADDYVLFDGATELVVENQSVHFLPFIGAQYTPDDRWFAQGMIQFDIDSNGNDVLVGTPGALTSIGDARDNAYMFVDLSVGYWIYKAHSRSATIQGVAPILEIHHNTTLDNGDAIEAIGLAAPGSTSVTNAVFGLTTQMSDNKNLTLGYATPIGGDSQFDGELRVFFNWTPGAGGLGSCL